MGADEMQIGRILKRYQSLSYLKRSFKMMNVMSGTMKKNKHQNAIDCEAKGK